MKRLLRWGFIVLLVAAVGWVGYLLLPAKWKAPVIPNFRTAAIVRGDLVSVVNSTGTVQPVKSVQVGAFVSGPIESADVDFNSEVKKDQILARIDQRTFLANIARDEALLKVKQAEVERVKALLWQAENNEKRAMALKAARDSFISDAEIDQVSAERKSLTAQLKLAEAAVNEADAALKFSQANLEYTVIRSPVDGVVVDRKIDPGQTVAAAFQTPILFIVAPEMEQHMFVNASVDEADIGLIREAQQRKAIVKFTVDAYPDDLFEGTIHQVRLNSATTQNVVTYTVVVEAPNPGRKLLPGMTASLSFQILEKKNILKLPNAALRYYPKAELVRPEDRHVLEGLDVEQTNDEASENTPSASEKVAAAQARNRRHVWVADGPLVRAVRVVTGLSDNKFTELVSGDLKVGRLLVTGVRPAPGGFGQ